MKPTTIIKQPGVLIFCTLMAFFMVFPLKAQEPGKIPPTETILKEFAESYRRDVMALDADFGIRVGQDWWQVRVRRAEKPYAVGKELQYTYHEFGPNTVTLRKGAPESPTWFFRFDDREILEKIFTGVLTASTAAAKSTGADYVAFDVEDMEGFRSTQQHTALSYLTMEHFWKRSPVEVTRFARESSLPSHGAQIVSLYTMKDKRIGWFTLGQEEAANADRGLDKSQVPNLFIIIKGRGKAEIGEEHIDLEPGMSVFVAPYMKHILYNPYPEPLEGILVLFGDNIDYARGQSYLSFLEEEYAFYGENEARVAAEREKVAESNPRGQ
ncbi:cupin domain-containing protein [Robiginitalea sp. SC105]|uniref:cupin domain-containing protein n=1 Tax=Robiginitalea sp. SC105 TaxID=2762332 RepID=UPI00163B1893|nr:cupin domain-containing protein [Robiginitalea sp. SC105]MBC2839386.1 cupin domain-containing protein [Robiginitalea sp. SC105]